MNWTNIIIFSFLVAVYAWSCLMLIRNCWVYCKRMELLESEYQRALLTGQTHLYCKTFESLPSYSAMMWKFWIWDVDKFLKK